MKTIWHVVYKEMTISFFEEEEARKSAYAISKDALDAVICSSEVSDECYLLLRKMEADVLAERVNEKMKEAQRKSLELRIQKLEDQLDNI